MILRRSYRYIFLIISISIIYYGFAELGLYFPVVNKHVTLIWPPSGIALACLFIFGYKIVPALMIGAFITNFFPGGNWVFASFTSIGNPAEAVLAYYILQNINFNIRIRILDDVLKLYFVGMLSCILAPSLGVLGLYISGVIPFDMYWAVWWKWWAGDIMGIIIFSPAILTLYGHFHFGKIEKKVIVEVSIFLVLLFSVCIVVFYDMLPKTMNTPLTFMLVPLIIYAALRFGQPLTSISTLLIAFIAIIATTLLEGPFVLTTFNKSVLLIYGFMSVVSLTGMILAVTNTYLKSSNQELQNFAYIASHNLKSPINNIISLLALYDKEAKNPEVNRQLIEKLETSALYLSEVLNDLLMIVTLKQKIEEEKKQVNLQELLHNIQKSIESQIKDSQVEFVEDFSKVKLVLYPSPIIHSVLLNLITNAIKYKHPDRLPRIEVKSFCEKRYIGLSVKDNGSGIDLKKHKKDLFGLYKRFHPSVRGRGIGLYMIKRQVETLGGEIQVKSEVGVGTEFRVYLYRI